MSFQEESTGVQVDSADGEEAGAQGSAEDPDQGALEPGLSLPSLSLATADPKVKNQKPQKFTFRDRNQNVLVLDSGTLTLIAVPHKSYICPEIFYVLASPLSSPGDKGNPVFLAVSGGELCLYCEMDKKKGRPALQLKNKKLAYLCASATKDSKGFTFYRKERMHRNTLESAAHKGWFISTCHANEPVRMTDKPGGKELTNFTFVPVSKAHTSPSEVSE